MSRLSPILAGDHWFVGEDRVFRFYVVTGEKVKASALAANGATSISVDPLKEALANGDKVRFNGGVAGVVATLSAAAAIGATVLTVAALSGAVQKGEAGYKVQVITGWTLQWVLRTTPEAAAATLTVVPTINSGVDGDCQVAVTDTDTLALPPATYFHTLRRSDAGNEVVLAYGDAVLQRAATRD